MYKRPPLGALISSLFFSWFSASQSFASSAFLEPLLNAGVGGSSIISNASMATNFGGGVRLALENQELFSALEFNGAVNDMGTGISGQIFTLGITAGGTFIYLPLRAWIGFDFLDTLSMGNGTASGYGIRLGLNYFFTVNMCLGLQWTNHNYTSLSTSSSNTSSDTSFGYNGPSLVFSMPIPLSQPKEPWKVRYEKQEARDRAEGGDADLAAPEQLPSAPAAEPLAELPQPAPGPASPETPNSPDLTAPMAPPPAAAPDAETFPDPSAPPAPDAIGDSAPTAPEAPPAPLAPPESGAGDPLPAPPPPPGDPAGTQAPSSPAPDTLPPPPS